MAGPVSLFHAAVSGSIATLPGAFRGCFLGAVPAVMNAVGRCKQFFVGVTLGCPFHGNVPAEMVKRATWLHGALDFVFPPLCYGCGVFSESRIGICERCLAAIDRYRDPVCLSCQSVLPSAVSCPLCGDEAFVLFACGHYEPPLKEIVLQFKFRGITSPAAVMAGMLDEQFGDQIRRLNAVALVPIPLYPSRQNYRGYNQAALLARQLSPRLGLPVREGVILRIKKRRPQARLNLKKRATNIRGVFVVPRPAEESSTVILVDDVVTSGATVLEARKTLIGAGYRVAGVIAIAHGA